MFFAVSCGDGSGTENGSADSDSTAGDSTGNDSSKAEDNDEQEKDDEKKAELIPVEVTTVKSGIISDFILLSSNLETEKMADVYSRVQGLVEKIYAQEGVIVQKGKRLMDLEADEYILAEERARLNYLQQKADFDRLEAMYRQDLLSIEEFDLLTG